MHLPFTGLGSASSGAGEARPDVVPGGSAQPAFADAVELLREQEAGGASWLEFCECRGIYQFLNREFLDELAAQLRRVATGEVLEIAAGRGDLSAALIARGLPVRATDAGIWPELMNGAEVERLDAVAALKRYRPATVLLSWPPIDARIYQAIWSEPSVRNIVTIDPCSDWLAALPAQWQAEALDPVNQWSLCRLDFLSGVTAGRLVQHSAAYRLARI